uniref:Uncharacterized protein n=1 Tax=Anolis carolinensis TaxID=28377 RepID=A0A803SZR6_ANOCA
MCPEVRQEAEKLTCKFNLDLTHPVEDGILDSGNCIGQFLKEKGNGETGNLRMKAFSPEVTLVKLTEI